MVESFYIGRRMSGPMPPHPSLVRPRLTKADGFTTAVVEINLSNGFGPLRCFVPFYKECERHRRRIFMARDNDADMPVEIDNLLELFLLASPRGAKLRISVECTDSTAERIVLRLASALMGPDSYNLDFDYFE